MDWIMIAIVGGSLLTSTHATEEACRGRAAMIEKDQKVATMCVKAPSHMATFNSYNGSITGPTTTTHCEGNICW
jgi:hypothetical protein